MHLRRIVVCGLAIKWSEATDVDSAGVSSIYYRERIHRTGVPMIALRRVDAAWFKPEAGRVKWGDPRDPVSSSGGRDLGLRPLDRL